MLELTQDPVSLTAALVDVPSVSGGEEPIADLVQAALEAVPSLQVVRDGNVVVATNTDANGFINGMTESPLALRSGLLWHTQET